MGEGAEDPALALSALLRAARADAALRQRLLAAPAEVLREHGIPAHGSGNLRRFMAALTADGELSEADLDAVAGGLEILSFQW